MTSHSKTPVPLSNDGLHYSASNLATLNDLSVIDMSCIDSTTIQELRQTLAQSVGLAQHQVANPWLIATTMVVDDDHLREQPDQERTAQQIAQNLVTQ
jgi:hypothetical protein